MSNLSLTNALTIDVEDYFQVSALAPYIPRDQWPLRECRVERNVDRILLMLDEKGVSATFFTLGWIAQRYPELVRRIANAGHEVASHGFGHQRASDLTEADFSADVSRAKKMLEDITGDEVKGYRAPSFSIGSGNRWALEVLAEEGYAYSSSVAPIRHDHYGWPEAPRFPHTPVVGSDMVEVPVTTVEYAGRRMACGGGGFFRLLPYGLSEWAIDRVNRVEGQSTVFYFHPWEIDPEQPVVPGAPLKSRIRHYTNLDVMEAKLARLLDRFRWDRMDRVFLGRETLKAAA